MRSSGITVLVAPSLLQAEAGAPERRSTAALIITSLSQAGEKRLFSAPEEFCGVIFVSSSLLVTSGPPDSSLQVWQVSAEDSGKGTCF